MDDSENLICAILDIGFGDRVRVVIGEGTQEESLCVASHLASNLTILPLS